EGGTEDRQAHVTTCCCLHECDGFGRDASCMEHLLDDVAHASYISGLLCHPCCRRTERRSIEVDCIQNFDQWTTDDDIVLVKVEVGEPARVIRVNGTEQGLSDASELVAIDGRPDAFGEADPFDQLHDHRRR